MTSANVTYYRVKDKDGKVVFEGSQHSCCKNTIRERLVALPDKENLTLHFTWPDENEAPHDAVPIPLNDYLAGQELVFPSTMGEALHDENAQLKQRIAQLEADQKRMEWLCQCTGWQWEWLNDTRLRMARGGLRQAIDAMMNQEKIKQSATEKKP